MKEIFYKEILPTLDEFNYGITNSETITAVKNLSKFASPIRPSSKQPIFKVPAPVSAFSDDHMEQIGHSTRNDEPDSLEFLQVETLATSQDFAQDLNESDPLNVPSQGWEQFNTIDEYGGGMIFTSSQINPIATNFQPLNKNPKKIEIQSFQIISTNSFEVSDSDDSDLEMVEVQENNTMNELEEMSCQTSSTPPKASPKAFSPPKPIVTTPEEEKPKTFQKNSNCINLLDFASSDESDWEDMEEAQTEPEASVKKEADSTTDSPEHKPEHNPEYALVFADSDDEDEEEEEDLKIKEASFTQKIVPFEEILRRIEESDLRKETC